YCPRRPATCGRRAPARTGRGRASGRRPGRRGRRTRWHKRPWGANGGARRESSAAQGWVVYWTTPTGRREADTGTAPGVGYTRPYTNAPVCSASRSAFMTGMYQTTIGAHNHRSHRDDGYQLPPGVRVLTEWFRDAGYKTANLAEMPAGFGFKGTAKTDW